MLGRAVPYCSRYTCLKSVTLIINFHSTLALYQRQSKNNLAQWTALISSTITTTSPTLSASLTTNATLTTTTTSPTLSTLLTTNATLTTTTTSPTTATSGVMPTAAPIVMSHCNGRLGNQVNFKDDYKTLIFLLCKEYWTAR